MRITIIRTLLVWIFLLASQWGAASDFLEPTYTIQIPMRDGTELPTDIYLPNPEAQGLPCVLLRSTAGRRAPTWLHYTALVKHGYAVAFQDTRSAMDNEGKSIPFWTDGWGHEQDGYDTVEWLSHSKITNGKIGTIGFSALGISQQMMAPSAPPSLKCQYIGFAAGSIYHHAAYPGGQLLKSQVEGWLGLYAKDPSIYSFFCNQPQYNEFWKNFDTMSVAHRVKAPAIHYGGWYDIFIQGTIDSFIARQERGGEGAKGKQKLIIGPWTHFWPATMKIGSFELPKNAQQMPSQYSPERWFDHYLKGIENKVEDLPPVTYYVMGPFDGSSSVGNVWRTAESWPIPSVKTPLYLAADNAIIQNHKPKEEFSYSYVYDPENPIPTIGGRNLFLDSGPMDQRQIESRDDVIVFTSKPLAEDIEITGHIFAKIFFSSDKIDTDVVVRFCDVYPDGQSILIADSIFRTGILHCGVNAVPHDPETPVESNLDLWSTSIIIPKGHRLRVSVSSSNYPRFEKNTHTLPLGKHTEKPSPARNKIFVGGKYPSRIILPIVYHHDKS